MENEKKEMTIKQKIDALQLVPLFPDTNYFEGKDRANNGISINDNSITTIYIRREADLTMTAFMFRAENTKKYGRMFSVVKSNVDSGTPPIYQNISKSGEEEYLDNLTELLNKYNEYYEATAKVFNEKLMESIKEELEKEKEKQLDKEQQEKQEKEEKGEQEKSEEQEQSEGEEGEEQEQTEGEEQEGEGEEESEGEGEEQESKGEGEGEGEEKEGEKGEKGEGEGEGGEGEEMSSEEIQKMIDDITKDQKGEGQQGQSDNKGDEIDLEDFLNEVEKGNADNDFGKNYNNQELKGQIDYEKQQQQPEGQEQPKGMPQEQQYSVTNVLGSVKEMFNTNDEDIKRRFPNPTSISDFIDALSKSKIDELADRVGLPSELSNLEKTKQIKSNLITEIQNI